MTTPRYSLEPPAARQISSSAGATRAAHAQALVRKASSRLPPADILPLGSGYLVVRRSSSSAKDAAVAQRAAPYPPLPPLPVPAGKQQQQQPKLEQQQHGALWSEEDFQQKLQHLDLLVQLRKVLEGRLAQARQEAAAAAPAEPHSLPCCADLDTDGSGSVDGLGAGLEDGDALIIRHQASAPPPPFPDFEEEDEAGIR